METKSLESQPTATKDSTESGVRPRCIVTLVHGTWGRGFFPFNSIDHSCSRDEATSKRRWFESGSPFHEELARRLADVGVEHRVRSFCWSGSNSVFARDRAATALAKMLAADLGDNPGALTVVIGHSHGGNVALRAMEKLNVDAERLRIITLATPFLRVFVLKASENFKILQFLLTPLILISAFYFLLPLTAIVSQTAAFKALFRFSQDLYFVTFSLSFGLLTFWLAAAILRIVVNPDFRLPGEWWLSSRWQKRPLKISSASYYDSSTWTQPKLLVLRGIDDEASFALALGAIGARLTNILMEGIGLLSFTMLSRVVRFRWLGGLLLVVILAISGYLSSLFGVEPFNFITGVGLIFVVPLCGVGLSLALLPFMLFIPGLFRASFGREFLLGAGCCNLAADSVPDIGKIADVITLPPQNTVAKFSLRHAIYAHPSCVEEAVNWLAEDFRATAFIGRQA